MEIMQTELPLPEVETHEQAAAVIMISFIRDQPHILLAERLTGPNAGQYTLPGGSLKPGEDPIQCAKRELREEAGLEVHEVYYVEYLILAHPCPLGVVSPGGHYALHIYFAFWDESTGEQEPQRIQPDKHGEWEWISVKDAFRLAIEGKLPMIIFRGWWMEVVEEIKELEVQNSQPISHGWPV